MALLNILYFPDLRLRKKAMSITNVNDEISLLADDMLETMYAGHGIGLAATQVNVQKRIIVIDVSANKNQPLVFINPEIIESEGNLQYEEGCLSIPRAYEMITRADKIRVRAWDRDGKDIKCDAENLLATCIQHEIDHLEGKLFIDYLSNLKRQRIIKRLKKHFRQDI
ncbi:MAG: peptide deformylase [Piscirickettsiaceae bacterium]|nr:peptide deformylase [Piscirickettsiaceae bacterium]